MHKMNLDPYLSLPYIEINLTWTVDLNVRAKAIKLLKIGEIPCGTELGQ